MKYIVLLREINISGKNNILMSELKKVLEENQYTNVSTYLNSGNVILESNTKNEEDIMKDIYEIVKAKFNLEIPIFVTNESALESILSNSPEWWGTSNKEIQPLVDARKYKTFNTNTANIFCFCSVSFVIKNRTLQHWVVDSSKK